MSLNPWPYVVAVLLGILIGSGIFWEIGSWRVNALKLQQSSDQNAISAAVIKQQQTALKEWQDQATKNAADAANIIKQQQDALSTAQAQSNALNQQIAGIQNVAKNLVATNVKLDAAHQQLLQAVSDAANSTVTGPAQAPSTGNKSSISKAISATKH